MKNYHKHITLFCLLAITPALVFADSNKEKDWSFAEKLYKDPVAKEVGDIVTVLIEENSSASKSAESSSEKNSSMGGSASFGHPRIDSQPTQWTNAVMPSWSLDSSRSFSGGGSLQNQDEFEATIGARVTEVLPNGNLLIEGKRSVVVQDEVVDMVLTGVVRPKDISRDNQIKSSQIADATIDYQSSGPMIKNQKRGLLTALWNWLNPF